jgi:hypothetical protein
VRDGIARHSKGSTGCRSAPIPSKRQHGRRPDRHVADIIAYVNHDIDDAVRAVLTRPAAG